MSNLSLVLLDSPVTPDMSRVVKAFQAMYPDLAAKTGAADTAGDPPPDTPLIRCGDELVAIMSMPASIPNDPGLWTRAATTWPEAGSVAARHRGHVIVSVLGKHLQPLAEARLTTAVIGALIAATPQCCAVVWGTKVARSAKLWMDEASRCFAPFPDYPCYLWFDIFPFRSETGIGAVTMGVSAFAGREIEFETDKLGLRTLLERVNGLAVYLIEHGAVIKDGDTVGSDEHEHITARHKISERFEGLPVLSCTMEKAF